MKKIKNTVSVVLFAAILLGVSAACLLKPADAFSDAERRALAQMPEWSAQSVINGEFMEGFESYSADQFPARDALRSFKAWWTNTVFQKKDNNGLFIAEGHISKLDEPENEEMLAHAAERFNFLYESYLKETDAKLYLTIVPDKNYYLAEKNGYPALNYPTFIEKVQEKTEYLQYIPVTDLLSADDYYTTDTHWKQENITDVAKHLLDTMGVPTQKGDYTVNRLEKPFYGVYTGQLARKTKPDTIAYLTSDTLDACTVTYYDTGKPVVGELYNMEKAGGKDPYEMFLSGSAPLLTIENPSVTEKRELVLFRDSFGSSIAPLLAEGYSKITVVDIRYIQSSFVGNFVDFDSCEDVLFLYSTSLLNNSLALR
ncbi:MAG: hypothetical protein IJD83_08920 [Clostridia bacterium]|nr:hypothetical protein [Clostridia bacterium]